MPKLAVSPDVAALNPEIDFSRPLPSVVSDLSIHNTPYKSQLENRVAQEWIPSLDPMMWGYEPMTFDLDGVRYTPDFILLLKNLSVVVVEAKGEYHNRRATRQVFRQLAHRNPSVFFCWLERKNNDWIDQWFIGGERTQRPPFPC